MKIKLLRYYYIVVLFGAMVTSCSKPADKEEAMTLYNESMKIHDEIMPRMDEMYKLESKLKSLKDSLLTDSTGNATKLSLVNEKLALLQTAGKDMMNWMHSIQDVPGTESAHDHHGSNTPAAEALPLDEVIKIQQVQKEAIEKVKRDMEESITRAKELLGTK